MKNNIWYCHPYAGGPTFGNSPRAYQLAVCWKRAQRNVTVICASWHHLMGNQHGFSGTNVFSDIRYAFVPVRRYRGNGFSRLGNMFDYCLGLARNAEDYAKQFGKPDVIVVSSPHPYAVLVCHRLARRWQARLVFEVRDLWPLSLTEIAGLPDWHPLALFTGWVERFAYRHVDACVSLLPRAEEHMRKRGLPIGHFNYIPNGVVLDSKPSSSESTEISNVLEFVQTLRERGCFVVVYPGAMGPPNNLEPLIEAAGQLAISDPDRVHFVLIGQGVDVVKLRQRVKTLGLSNVHFFDQVRRGTALSVMRLASAGYVSVRRSSIYRFGISFNKLFEYMKQELPVVFAADVPDNPIGLSGCGVVTSPDEPNVIAESIRELSTLSITRLREMGGLGKKYVLQFHDYELLAKKYLDIFDTI